MEMHLKKYVSLFLLIIITFSLSACGNSKTVVDYGNAEAFESALNHGENLEGKSVMFQVAEFHPDSKFGYNLWAGEHLNFISSEHPNVKAEIPFLLRRLR